MEKSLLIPLTLQVLFSLFLLFRFNLPRALRFLLIVYCAFLVWFWYPELYATVNLVLEGKWLSILKETLTTAAASLIWLWPFILAIVIYLSQDYDAFLVLVILFVFTLIVWLGNFLVQELL